MFFCPCCSSTSGSAICARTFGRHLRHHPDRQAHDQRGGVSVRPTPMSSLARMRRLALCAYGRMASVASCSKCLRSIPSRCSPEARGASRLHIAARRLPRGACRAAARASARCVAGSWRCVWLHAAGSATPLAQWNPSTLDGVLGLINTPGRKFGIAEHPVGIRPLPGVGTWFCRCQAASLDSSSAVTSAVPQGKAGLQRQAGASSHAPWQWRNKAPSGRGHGTESAMRSRAPAPG